MAIETKSFNNLNTLLQNIEKFDEDIQDFATFVRTLLDDLTDYQTLSTFTLRRLADMPTIENTKDNSKIILDTLNELKNTLGLDYLDKIKYEKFADFSQLGNFELEDNANIVVICVRSLAHLNERASRKAQYDISKKILKGFQTSRAGIFIYYDSKGDFRISLIYTD